MQWLGEWIEQIIILVLIATFLHLLLPNPAMERYVKLAMGLLIILAIVSPILHLFTHRLDVDKIGFTTSSLLSSKSVSSLDQIKENSQQLERVQGQLVEKQTTDVIRQMIKQQIQQKFAVEVIEVKVTMEPDKETFTRIKSIHTRLRRDRQEDASMQDKSMEPVPSVQPVQIGPIQGPSAHPQVPPSIAPSSQPDEVKNLSYQIIHDLALTWNVKEDQIQLQVESSD